MLRPFRVTPPTGDVIAVDAKLRLYCSVDDTTFDEVLADLVAAAVDHLDGLDGALRRCILEQTWAAPVPETGNTVHLPFPDCRSLSVELLDGGSWSAVTGATLTQYRDYVDLEGLPDDRSGISVRFEAGWQTPADVPHSLKQGIRFLVAQWFRHPEGATVGMQSREIQTGAWALLGKYRHHGAW